MRFSFLAVVFFVLLPQPQSAYSAAASPRDDVTIISEATGGRFKARKGQYFDQNCRESIEYEADVVDLNNDGQPEVFTQVYGSCWGGMAGVHMNLFIKDKNGQWQSQFGFTGSYKVLKTKNKGYPDIEIGGPGFCFPVWRWNGQQYQIHKKCPR
jgi:hypothetical protein